MKRTYLILSSLAFMQFLAKAQSSDSIPKVNKTQIDVVYNHYTQDGNNSAVTGGIGTERLIVYSPAMSIKKIWGGQSVKLNGGADIISSASTDNIDFIMSSASARDLRAYANVAYDHHLKKPDIAVYGGIGFSVESDYFSIGSKIGVVKTNSKQLANYTAELQVFNDDLRWGRVNLGYLRPVKLIYPSELRYKDWYDTYQRNSYNLKLGCSKVINKRTILGVYPLLSYQNGLLATPFHRVFFDDGSHSVEQLPAERYKASVGLKWHQFLGGRFVLKNTLNPYIDNWGIAALAIEHETAIKLNAAWTFLPNMRLYWQQGSPYFAPYEAHKTSAEFYTSDFDLSTIQTYNGGVGIKFAPYSAFAKQSQLNTFILRYNFLQRSNGLTAHILSLSIQIERNDSKNRLGH